MIRCVIWSPCTAQWAGREEEEVCLFWFPLFSATHQSRAVSEFALCISLWRTFAPCGIPAWLQQTTESDGSAGDRESAGFQIRLLNHKWEGIHSNINLVLRPSPAVMLSGAWRSRSIWNSSFGFMGFFSSPEDVMKSEPSIFMHRAYDRKFKHCQTWFFWIRWITEAPSLFSSTGKSFCIAGRTSETNLIWKQAEDQLNSARRHRKHVG